MAENIQNTKRNTITGQTWKEAFEGVDTTSKAFHNLVEEFSDFVGDWNEFSDLRRERLIDYIEGLGSVEDHWEEINDWIKQNSSTLDSFTGGLSDIRLLFQNISAEIGGIRRQTVDRINLTRQLSSLANDALAAAQQEGGLSDRSILNLDRRKTRLAELYNAQLKQLGVLREDGEVDEELARAAQRRNAAKIGQYEKQIYSLRRIGGDRNQIRNLEEQVKHYQIINELLDDNNRKAIKGLEDQIDRQRKLYRNQRKGIDAGTNAFSSNKVTFTSKILRKVGLSDEADNLTREYGEWITDRVKAQQSAELAEESAKNAQAEYERIKADFDKKYDFEESTGQYRNRKTGQFVSKAPLRAQKDLVDEAELAAEEARKAQEDIFSRPFNILNKLKGSAEDFSGILLKVAGILALILFRQLLKIDEEAVKTKRVIGQWADYSAVANTKFVSGVEVLRTMRELGEQFHINPVQVFSPEEIANISRAQKFTGMTAEAAGNLGVQSRIIGKNANIYRDSIAAGANQANRLNHSAINLSAVQNDVLQTSRAITMSYGQNVEGLARAASTAAALGTNLQGVEDIAKNLMNFESSIESEMQAQLLTGMQLNLAKAREYALNNDLEGVAREVSRQGMDAVRFSHMNYIQQENMAKALGMSREQMSKMLIMQEINAGLSAKQVAAMTGMRKEDIEALSAQEKWQTMKQKFLESLVPLLEPILQVTTELLRPIAGIVGFLTKIVGYVLTLGGLTERWPTWLRGIWALGIAGLTAWILHGRTLLVLGTRIGGVFRGVGNIFKGLKLPTFTLGGSGSAAAGVAGMGGTFQALGKGWSGILRGAAAVAIMVGAIAGLGWALKQFKEVSIQDVGVATAAIAVLVASLAGLGALVAGPLGVAMFGGVVAIALMVGVVQQLGKALQEVGSVRGDELLSIATGITSIAGAIGTLSGKLANLDISQLRALGRAFKNLKGANVQVSTYTEAEEPRESIGTSRETIEAAVQTITVKQAQIQASAQQISVEQKAADLTKIEQKLNSIITVIRNSKPDWNWLEFKREMTASE